MSDRTYRREQVARLGETIRTRRRELGLTQDEVAELAETTQRFISTLETGKQTARLDKVVDVAAVLGLTLRLEPHDATRL